MGSSKRRAPVVRVEVEKHRAPMRPDVLWMVLCIKSTRVEVWMVDRRKMQIGPGKIALGMFHPTTNRIEVCEDLDEGTAESTLVHEVVHAQLWHDGVPWWDDERLVNPMGAAYYDAMKRNHLLNIPVRPPRRSVQDARCRGMRGTR